MSFAIPPARYAWARRLFPLWLGLTPTVLLFPIAVWGLLVLAGAGGSPTLLAVANAMDPTHGWLWPWLLFVPFPLYVAGNLRAQLRLRRAGLYLGFGALSFLVVILVALAIQTGAGVPFTALVFGFQWWGYTAFLIHFEH